MKTLWKNFIGWFKPKTRNEVNHKIDDDRLEQHMNLDLSHSVEGGKITPLDLSEVENIARTEGITLDEGEEIISLKQDKMQKLIDQKKNRKPFYKDDNKKDWE